MSYLVARRSSGCLGTGVHAQVSSDDSRSRRVIEDFGQHRHLTRPREHTRLTLPNEPRRARVYRFDRLIVPKLKPLHEVRPATAVSRLDVTATLISVKPRA